MRRPTSMLWMCAAGLLAAHVLYRLSIGERIHSVVLVLAAGLAALLTLSTRRAANRVRRPDGDVRSPDAPATPTRQSWLPLVAAASITIVVLGIALL